MRRANLAQAKYVLGLCTAAVVAACAPTDSHTPDPFSEKAEHLTASLPPPSDIGAVSYPPVPLTGATVDAFIYWLGGSLSTQRTVALANIAQASTDRPIGF